MTDVTTKAGYPIQLNRTQAEQAIRDQVKITDPGRKVVFGAGKAKKKSRKTGILPFERIYTTSVGDLKAWVF